MADAGTSVDAGHQNQKGQDGQLYQRGMGMDLVVQNCVFNHLRTYTANPFIATGCVPWPFLLVNFGYHIDELTTGLFLLLLFRKPSHHSHAKRSFIFPLGVLYFVLSHSA